MIKVNIYEIKARFSEYLDRAARGERILIHRHNKPVAELRAVEEARTEPRPIGPLRGRPTFEVPASFFEPLPDEDLDLWEGTATAPGASSRTKARRGVQQGRKRRPRGNKTR